MLCKDLTKLNIKTNKRFYYWFTDGFPTDENPQNVILQAKKLQQLDVDIFVFMVTGSRSQQQLRAIHQGFLEQYIEGGNFNPDSSYQQNYSKYYLELLGDGSSDHKGVLRSIASASNIYYVRSSKQLKTALHNVIELKAMQCE